MTTQVASTTTRTIDVAIVGTGYAGLAAAIEASANLPPDRKIVLLEKMPTPGKNIPLYFSTIDFFCF
jgi:cation diffusion facilitator CzcD-associated flavoprotein CzcO